MTNGPHVRTNLSQTCGFQYKKLQQQQQQQQCTDSSPILRMCVSRRVEFGKAWCGCTDMSPDAWDHVTHGHVHTGQHEMRIKLTIHSYGAMQ